MHAIRSAPSATLARRALLTALGGLVLGLGACASPAPAAPETWVVASDFASPPFLYRDGDGEVRGRDREMLELLARDLGVRLEYRTVPFEELLDALEDGRGDLVCATLGITPERAQRVRFSRPYHETGLGVVARRGAGAPRSVEDLAAGAKVAAAPGTTSERAVRRLLPACTLVPGGEADFAAWLAQGRVEACVLDSAPADRLASSPGLVRWEEDLEVERYALALPLERGDRVARLDAVLARLEREGVLATLDALYGL